MAAAQNGDAIAYTRLLTGLAPFVRSLIRRRCGDPDLLEDIVQDVLLTVHRVRHTYDPSRSLSAWVAAIAMRRRIDTARRRSRIETHETVDATAYETFADPAANKEERSTLEAGSTAALLSQLPPRQRRALELVKIKDMSLAEAARESGQTVAALKVNVHRAIKRLQDRWGKP